jgi:hypothetical protein
VRARKMAGAARTGRETTSGQIAIARDASHGQDTELRREAPPVAEDEQYGREASPGQVGAGSACNSRETGQLSLHCVARNWPDSLTVAPTQVGWSDTPPLGYTAVCRDFPFALSPHSLPFRSTGGESEKLASRSRDCATGKCTHRLRGGIGMKECFRCGTQHTLSVRSWCPCGNTPTLILFAPTLPASGTLRRGIKVRQCAVVCQPAASLSRCVLPDPRARSAHCRPVRHAPRQFAGILHANSAAPPLMQPGELARSARSEKQRRLAVA